MTNKRQFTLTQFLIILCFLFAVIKGTAQSSLESGIGGVTREFSVVPATPDAAAFQRYGNLPVNTNTGIPDIKVPVYTISLNGFTWPIALSFHAGGFKSDDIATRTGLGWTLTGQGIISSQQSAFDNGILTEVDHVLDLGTYTDPLEYNTCFYNDPGDISIADGIVSGAYRVGLDYFFLNAGPINGKFEGTTGVMFPASDIKIGWTGLDTAIGYGYSGCLVLDNAGNRYEFMLKGENVLSSYCVGITRAQVNPVYYLTKITTRKKETIVFTYDEEIFSYHKADLHVVKSYNSQPSGCSDVAVPEDYYCENEFTATEQRLKKITVSNGVEIDFVYSSRDDIVSATKLDSIKVSETHSGVTTGIQQVKLNYGYFGSGSTADSLQLKLNSVSIKDNASSYANKYKFTYQSVTSMPSKRNIWYWEGYYTLSPAGVLVKLEYPTGGYTTFGYEGSVGGLRIGEIRDYASASTETGFRKFEYGTPTSGSYPTEEYELVHYFGNPANGNPINSFNPCTWYSGYAPSALLTSCTRTIKKSTPFISSLAEMIGTQVSYDSVVEYFGKNGKNGKIEYIYGTYDGTYDSLDRTYPDLPYLTNPSYLKQKRTFKKNPNGSYSLVAKLLHSYAVPSGTSGVSFNIKNVFLTRPELQWSCGSTSVCFPKQYLVQDFKVASVPMYLTKTIEETYSGSDKIANAIQYFYDTTVHLNPTRMRTINSAGDTIETTNKYAHNFSGTAVYDSMIARNITSQVIESTKKELTGNTELEHVKMNLSLWESNTLVEPTNVQASQGGNSLQTETAISSYTSNGQLQEIVGKDGVVTSYIWGYGNQYLVAKIVGKTFNAIISAGVVSFTEIENPSSDYALRTELNNLRSLSGAFVTTYTYKPQVGISSITDVTGKTAYYEYDGFKRLSIIRDQDSNIVKKICYNFYDQVEDCSGEGTNAVWVSNDSIRCKACAANNIFYSPMKEIKQIDINPSSGSYNTTRWVDYANDSTCLPNGDWIVDTTVALYCEVVGGNNTGYRLTTLKNINPCSPYYNQSKSAYLGGGQNCSLCPTPPVWVPTGDTLCEIVSGSYTGYVLREEINMSLCSTTPYATTRYVQGNYNPTVCSETGCNSNNCPDISEGYKCINNVCEQGIKVYTDSYLIDEENWIYNCVYHYEFSDNSWSPGYLEMSYSPCL